MVHVSFIPSSPIPFILIPLLFRNEGGAYEKDQHLHQRFLQEECRSHTVCPLYCEAKNMRY